MEEVGAASRRAALLLLETEARGSAVRKERGHTVAQEG